MGALEGAAMTVLSKGAYFPSNPLDPTLLAGFPDGSVLFTQGNVNTTVTGRRGHTPCDGTFPSNFQCNPSSIDGLTITDSSQMGPRVMVALVWGHNIQIANNRVRTMHTLRRHQRWSGRISSSVHQGSTTNAAPGSSDQGFSTG